MKMTDLILVHALAQAAMASDHISELGYPVSKGGPNKGQPPAKTRTGGYGKYYGISAFGGEKEIARRASQIKRKLLKVST